MPSHFDLIIKADYPTRTAELFLKDAAGTQLAYRQIDFKTIEASRRLALFDLRNYLKNYVPPQEHAEAIARTGICIAEDVLGEEIFRILYAAQTQRTLRIQLPGAKEEKNYLAAALTRVPWEIARPSARHQTLAERALVIRIVHDMAPPASKPIEVDSEEALRVLFVFAEAKGSTPLGARQEREELLRLFQQEIYPHRRIVAHFLSHGVTRERLVEQIEDNGGYHIVHWSGHGKQNRLELAKPGGESDRLSGQELLRTFFDAGGFLPQLFVLSACHSGDILSSSDWQDFLSMAEGKEPGSKTLGSPLKDIDWQEEPGYTGTAHALLQGGVPTVVAMRYAVGDHYARELAVEFYHSLLADAKPKSAAVALTRARRALLSSPKYEQGMFVACDHATPVLFGEEDPGLKFVNQRSPALKVRQRRLHQVGELTMRSHEHFVGRTWELASLGSDFIGARSGVGIKPVATVVGIGGMGKTALAAEALALWESRFDWVLLYQAKPSALSFDGTLRDIHMKLDGELDRYHKWVKEHPADAIYRPVSGEFSGAPRFERLIRNLVRALQDEAILLVLDNFETNLKPSSDGAGMASSSCQDEWWDKCLAILAEELVGSPSRVLITCRRPLTTLVKDGYLVTLGPLPRAEAALYLRTHPTLSHMIYGGDAEQEALAKRLLNASRFHPLLMDRLVRLAGDPALREQLESALVVLETSKDFSTLPELFSTVKGDEKELAGKELAYLEDALSLSLDKLIEDVSVEARQVLWLISLANQPEILGLVQFVWNGESVEQARLRQIRVDLSRISTLPPDHQQWLQNLSPEVRAMVDAVGDAPVRPAIEPLASRLVSVGLVTVEVIQNPENPNIWCHELVRERIRAWMESRPTDRGDLTSRGIHALYGDSLATLFQLIQHRNSTLALSAGSRAIVYFVQAEAFDKLGDLAGSVINSTDDPQIVSDLIEHLTVAAETAPHGRSRWRCLTFIADALAGSGRPDASLLFFQQAAVLARAAVETDTEGKEFIRLGWSDLSWILGNWAGALQDLGDFSRAHARRLESAEAAKKAGRPIINVIMSELEALRYDIIEGKVTEALPEILSRLETVEGFWTRHRAGESVPEAPDAEDLVRAYISTLDIARFAHLTLSDWGSTLSCCDALLAITRTLGRPASDIASTRVSRAVALQNLDRFGEAQTELGACLDAFEGDPAQTARTLNALASLFDAMGDWRQALVLARRALAKFEQLLDPHSRAWSHGNLANYLGKSGDTLLVREAEKHQLAALVYSLATGLGQSLQTSFHNYTIVFRRALSSGIAPSIPTVASLVSDPAFASLAHWLAERGIPLDQLQDAVDNFLDQSRQAAEQQHEAEEQA